MAYTLTATNIKEWFQYSCERKFLYNADNVDHTPTDFVAKEFSSEHAGIIFEQAVEEALEQESRLLQLKKLSNRRYNLLWRRFLNCTDGNAEWFANQVQVSGQDLPTDFLDLENVSFSFGMIDLVRRFEQDGTVYLQIIDIKNAPVATHFHRIQVAYYSMVLEHQLAQLFSSKSIDHPVEIYPIGAIWKTTEEPDKLYEIEEFNLATYRRQLEYFFHNELPELSSVSLHPQDNSDFHLYYKCEQCKYQQHCNKSVQTESATELDLSAIYGVTQYSKATLIKQNFKTVGDFASLAIEHFRLTDSWKLQKSGRLFVQRARALLQNKTMRIQDSRTVLMPPSVDCPIILLNDRNPNKGHLVTLGILWVDTDGQQHQQSWIMHSQMDELKALVELSAVLDAVFSNLSEWNQHNPTAPKIGHLYGYESSEFDNLKQSLHNWASDPDHHEALKLLLRIFPPDGVVPDPSIHQYNHTPYTQLRNTFEQLFAVPAKVSYDLARVTQALQSSTSFTGAYIPHEALAHPYSSKLSIEACEEITKDEPPSEEWFEQLRQDISDRLNSIFALLQWVMQENSTASVPFLLMKKVPFIDTHAENPVDWNGLNGLQKQVQFGGEVSKTAHFMTLSKPLSERMQSRDSYGNLKLSSIQAPEGRQTAYRLFFQSEEQHPHIFKCSNQHNWFLHQENVETLFDETPEIPCGISKATRENEFVTLEVHVHKKIFPTVESLFTMNSIWHIDAIYNDPNTPRVIQFIDYLQSLT